MSISSRVLNDLRIIVSLMPVLHLTSAFQLILALSPIIFNFLSLLAFLVFRYPIF